MSCNQNSTKGIRCATGKAKKSKNYRLKKIKSYQKGYPSGGGSAPVQAKRKKQQADPLDTETITNDSTLEPIPIDTEVAQIPIPQELETDENPTNQRDTIRRRVVERRSLPPTETATNTETPEDIEPTSPNTRDTIRRRVVERRSLPPTETATNTETQENSEPTSPNSRDTIRRRVVERRSLPPTETATNTETQENSEPTSPSPRDTLRRTTVIRQSSPNQLNELNVDLYSTINDEIDFDPLTQFVFKDTVYEKDEDFEYEENISFVPNFDILLYPEQAEKSLDSLITLLKEFPDKKVYIYGNGGFDDADKRSESELKYRKVLVNDDPFGFQTWTRAKNYFGKNRHVYEQNFYLLGNSDPHELNRIREEGLRERNPYTGYNIGELLLGRAKTIERILISKGIDKKRIISKRGEFLPRPNHTVLIRVEND